MTFFGGVMAQNYVASTTVRPGWLALATADGKYLWLMSNGRPCRRR